MSASAAPLVILPCWPLLWFVDSTALEPLFVFPTWQLAYYFLLLWKLNHRKEAFMLDPAQIIQVLCSKPAVFSRGEGLIQKEKEGERTNNTKVI